MNSPSRKGAAGAVAVAAVGGAVAIGRGAVHTGEEASHIRPTPVHPVPHPEPPPLPHPTVTPTQRAEAADFVRNSMCDAINDLYDRESPGVITTDEILQDMAFQASESLTGVPVEAVTDATGNFLTAAGIYNGISPTAAYQYLRRCGLI